MQELIDRDVVLSEINEEVDANQEYPEDKLIRKGLRIARKIIENAPSVNRWIPCGDRMPDHYKDILFCERDRTIHKGYLYWDGTFIENHVKFRKSDIVAWMPMPDAYEPSEKE